MRVSREISLGSSLHRASTDALIETVAYKPEQEEIGTLLGMTPGLCMRADLTAWKTSTTPSVFRRSN